MHILYISWRASVLAVSGNQQPQHKPRHDLSTHYVQDCLQKNPSSGSIKQPLQDLWEESKARAARQTVDTFEASGTRASSVFHAHVLD
jgi:hypothetical protein